MLSPVAAASDTLEFTAGSDTVVFPHLQSTTTTTITTPYHSKTPVDHQSPRSISLEQTTESLSYSPDVAATAIVTPREDSNITTTATTIITTTAAAGGGTFRPIVAEPNDNEYSGDYSNEFDMVAIEEDCNNSINSNTNNNSNNYPSKNTDEEVDDAVAVVVVDGDDDEVDHDMYRDFTPSPPASATAEVDQAVSDDDDMYNYTWDGEGQDSPSHGKEAGDHDSLVLLLLGPTESAASPSHHAAAAATVTTTVTTTMADEMSLSEEQMMMELPSIVREDMELQHEDDEEDEYYNDYNEFNNTGAAVLDQDSLYDLDPFD